MNVGATVASGDDFITQQRGPEVLATLDNGRSHQKQPGIMLLLDSLLEEAQQ